MNTSNSSMTSGVQRRIFGGILGGYLAVMFRLMPFLARLGPFGILLAFLFMIASLGLFVLGLLALMFLLRQFEVTPAGQFVSMVLTIGGGLFAVYLWVGRQSRSVGGVLRLIALAVGLAALAWAIWQSGFFHEARLNYMQARFEQDPVYYVGRIYLLIASLVLGVVGAALGVQRFVRNAYHSPLSFVLAIVRLSLMALVVVAIVALLLSSGYFDNVRSRLDEALNPAWLTEEYSSPR